MKTKKDQMKEWVERWKSTGEILEKMRIEEVRQRNTSESMLALTDAFEFITANYSLPETSGLVEQQRWFMQSNYNAQKSNITKNEI